MNIRLSLIRCCSTFRVILEAAAGLCCITLTSVSNIKCETHLYHRGQREIIAPSLCVM